MVAKLASLLVLLVVGLAGGVRAEAPSKKKAQATAAFRAKRFAAACPLFAEAVTGEPDDGWGWNDLALCRVRLLDLEQALPPLRRAKQLALETGDDALSRAVETNARLVAKGLLAKPASSSSELRLALEVSRLLVADALGCELLERVRTVGEASFEAEDWWNLTQCLQVSRAPSPVVLRVAVRAFQSGATQSAQAVGWYPDAEPLVAGVDWKRNCHPLDGAACGRQWLLCKQPGEEGGVEQVVIEASSLAKWARSPFTQRAQVINSFSTSSDMRCLAPDGVSALDSAVHEDLALGFDACTATWVRWQLDDESCENEGVRTFTQQRFTLATP